MICFRALSAGWLLIIWAPFAHAAEPVIPAPAPIFDVLDIVPVLSDKTISSYPSKEATIGIALQQLILPPYKQRSVALAPSRKLTFVGLGKTRTDYVIELLNSVFAQYPAKGYSVSRFAKVVPHHRTFYYLEKHEQVDVVIGYATEEREKKFRSIPIPVLKGLNGWRLSILHKDNTDIFQSVTTLEQLREFLPGLHPTWTDYKILQANQLPVVGGADFNGLYYMLHEKRFDYFLRSVLVIDKELETFRDQHKLHLVIDPYLLVKYPTAIYLYVNKNENELADDILNGLEVLIKSGEFDLIFNKHFGAVVAKVQSEKRRTIELHNPLLPASVPLQRSELWIAN